MEKDIAKTVMAVMGGVLIGCAMIDEISKNISPELEKAIETKTRDIPLLSDGKKDESKEQDEKDKETDGYKKEIEELKEMIKKYEEKQAKE